MKGPNRYMKTCLTRDLGDVVKLCDIEFGGQVKDYAVYHSSSRANWRSRIYKAHWGWSDKALTMTMMTF